MLQSFCLPIWRLLCTYPSLISEDSLKKYVQLHSLGEKITYLKFMCWKLKVLIGSVCPVHDSRLPFSSISYHYKHFIAIAVTHPSKCLWASNTIQGNSVCDKGCILVDTLRVSTMCLFPFLLPQLHVLSLPSCRLVRKRCSSQEKSSLPGTG